MAMSPLDHEEGPPVLVLKLAFQFLQWNDFTAEPEEKILNNVDLVSKKWRRLLHEDDVGRQLCINQIKSYDEFDELQPKLKGQNL